jgi:membrane-bound lytic murein transglycosylase B
MNRIYSTTKLAWLIFILGVIFTCSVNADITQRKGVKSFIDSMVKNDGFDRDELEKLFKTVTIKKKIIDAMNRPWEDKPWFKYRPIFLTKDRINGGVEFWNEHEKTLAKATEKYGVPSEIIIAIIGVESKYGRHKGKFRVVDALSTLGFAYPKRKDFFRKELREFLLLAKEEKVDPATYLGSYAGAMGKPQFIPSSYRRYAVDFDADGKRDLLENTDDVIGSVANYFSRHHWQKDLPITERATVKGKRYKKVVKQGIRPKLTVGELEKRGIKAKSAVVPKGYKAALIELELKKGKEYWLGLDNFFVITRYNHSQHYAMAVYLLSEEIRKARNIALAKSTETKK